MLLSCGVCGFLCFFQIVITDLDWIFINGMAFLVSFFVFESQVKLFHVESKFASAIPDHTSEITLEGKVKDGVPHLSKVGSFSVDVSLEGSIILCRQVDQPGMIGKVGSVLGGENINISFMSVGRISPRQHAVMAIGVDDEPSKAVLQKLGGIAAIEELVFLKL